MLQVIHDVNGGRTRVAQSTESMVARGTVVARNACSFISARPGSKRTYSRLNADKGHAAALAAFIASCQQGGGAPIPWPHPCASTVASILAERSTREGVPFELDLP